MINSIEIKDFQSHKKSLIEFHPGVNTLIGTSSHGKSSVARAFNLVKDNKPEGHEFVSTWLWNDKNKPTGNSEITIRTEDGYAKKVKGKENYYEINETTLNAVGRGGAPEEILNFLNMNEVNIQKQEENFFLLGMSSPEVMRKINSFVDLELIDKTLSNAESDARANAASRRSAQASISDLDTKLENYSMLDDLESKYNFVINLWNQIEKFKIFVDKANELLAQYKVVREQIDALGPIDKIERKYIQAVDMVSKYETAVQTLNTANKTVEKYLSIKQELEKYPTSKVFDDYNEAITLYNKYNDLLSKRNKASEILTRVKEIREELNTKINVDLKPYFEIVDQELALQSNIKLAKKYIEDFQDKENRKQEIIRHLEELENKYHELMPDTCPFCGK